MKSSSDVRIIGELEVQKTKFMEEACYHGKCIGCGGFLLIFRSFMWRYYCHTCKNAGVLVKPNAKDIKRCEEQKDRWYQFRAMRHLFDDVQLPSNLLRTVGLSTFSNDPVRILMKDRLYGYVENYAEFKSWFKQDREVYYLTENFNVYPLLRKKPAFVLPLERYPGLVVGFTAVMEKVKFSMCDRNTIRSGKADSVFTFLQVGTSGDYKIFDDILEDFDDIIRTLMFNKDITVAVRPVSNHQIDTTVHKPVKA